MTHKNTQHKSYKAYGRGRSFIGALLGNLTAVVALLICSRAGANIVGPYSPDANTLHLWHMDTNAVPVVDSVSGGKNLTGMANGATLTNASYSGFGTAVSTFDGGQDGIAATNRDAYLSALPLVSGAGDNVAMSCADPVTGAFTYEAIIRVDFDPTKNFNTVALGGNGRAAVMYLISAEDEANSGRVFQFRIDPIGTASGNTTVNLTFANVHLAVAPIQTITIPIPTTGPDAIASNNWYHVAVVYDGNENAVDNITFYWTLLDPSRTSANPIGTWSMQVDLPTASGDFAIGNTGRSPPNLNFVGLIDEVRISKVARQATEMMFAIPDAVITAQPIPSDLTVGTGQPAAFSATAVGQQPLYYQWRRFGTNLLGATQNAYSIPSAQSVDAGSYDLVVTNSINAVTSSVVTLTVRTPISLVWSLGASSDWNLTDMNWDSNNDLVADAAFSPGDNVRFDNQGAALPSVNLVGVLTPSSVVVGADTDYTLTTVSGGAISSNAKLTKRGTGTLTLDTDNSYTGATVIENGTLQVGAGAGRGQLGSGPVTNNAALVFNRTGSLSLGSTLAGTGSLTNNAAGIVTVSGTNLLSGPITLNAGGLSLANLQAKGNSTSILFNASANSAGTTRLTVSGGMVFGSSVPFSFLGTSASPDYRCSFNASDSTNSVNGPVLLDGSATVQLSADGTGQIDILGNITGSTLTGSLLLRGTGNGNIYGTINLPNGTVNKTEGGVWTVWSTGNFWTNSAVVNGTLRLGVSQALPTNMVLRMGQANSTGILDLAGFNQQLGGLGDNLLGGSEIIGNSSTNSDSLLTLATTNTWLFSGIIRDAISNGTRKVAFTLAGGTLTLTNASTYSGDTTISAGTLALAGVGSIGNSLAINIAPGATLSASGRTDGTFTLNAAQTLQGNGAFYVLGNVTNKGTIRLKLNKAGVVLSNDSIDGANQISYGGTLNLVITGDALGTNDTFKLFNATTYAGAFASIVPATPGAGLVWNTTTLATDGTLRVFPLVTPQFASVALSGTNLVFNGTNGNPGAQFVLLASTNITAPLSSWTPVLTDVFNGSGTFVVTNAISSATPLRFFAIRTP